MAKEHKGQSEPRLDERGKGEHGGGGERRDDAKGPKKSSQAAGKDPHRGEREK